MRTSACPLRRINLSPAVAALRRSIAQLAAPTPANLDLNLARNLARIHLDLDENSP